MAMSFQQDGFLSDEAERYASEIRARYEEKFDLCQLANRCGHALLHSLEIAPTDLRKLLLGTLLARQLESFQSFVLLVFRGLHAPADIVLRNIAENMFIVGAIGKDEEFADRYVLAEELSRKKALVRLRDHGIRTGGEVGQKIHDTIAELEQRIDDERIRRIPTERIAQIAELSDYYDTLYSYTSMAVHTSPRRLDHALQANERREVEALRYGPASEDLDMSLDFALSMVLYTFHEVATRFGRPTAEIERLQTRNQEVAGGA